MSLLPKLIRSVLIWGVCASAFAATTLIDQKRIEAIQVDKSGKYVHNEKQPAIKVGTGQCATSVTFVMQSSQGLMLDVEAPKQCGFRQIELLIHGDVLPLTALSDQFKQKSSGAYAWQRADTSGAMFFAASKQYTAEQIRALRLREPLCPKGDPDCLSSPVQGGENLPGAQNSSIDGEKINSQYKSGGEHLFLKNITQVGTGKCETNFLAVKQTKEGVLVEINPPEKSVGERSCSFRQLELLIGGDVLSLKYLDEGFKRIPDGGYKWHTDVPAALFFAGQKNRPYSKTELLSLGIRDALCNKDTTDCLNSGTQVATPAPATSFTKAPLDINSPTVTQQAFVMPPAPKVAVANAIGDALSLNDPTVTAHIKAYQAGKANDESFYLRMPRQFSVTTDLGNLYGYKEEDASNGNMTDRVLIAPTFTTASEFDRQTGIAVACTAPQKCGLINTKGQFVVPPLAAYMSDSSLVSDTGLIQFMPVEDSAISTKCGFIGFDGKIKISPIFNKCGYFSTVNSFGPDGHKNFIAPAEVQLSDDRWGFILPNGEWGISRLYQEISTSGSGDPIAVKRDGLWGYVVANSDGKSMRYLVEPGYRVVGSWYGSETNYFFWASKTQSTLNENRETDGCLTSAQGFIQDTSECRKRQWTHVHQAPGWLYHLCQWLPDGYLGALTFLLSLLTLVAGIGWSMLRKQLLVFRLIRFTKTARLLQIAIVIIPLAAFFAALSYFTPDDPVYGGSANAAAFGLFEWLMWVAFLTIGALPISLVFAAISSYQKRRKLAKEKAVSAKASKV